mgnify:CR=1 FL=1
MIYCVADNEARQDFMMQSCVVIPVYKARMSETEMASFRQALSVFGKSQRTVVIATFNSLDVSRYEEEASLCGVSLQFEHFPSECFASIHSYNCLMLNPAFYGRFSGYDYILIFQLDAWVFVEWSKANDFTQDINYPTNRVYAYILRADMLGKCRENMKILHPLPRVNEIEYDVDESSHAYYFQQAQNGLYARQALISHVLGYTLDDIVNDSSII